MDDSRPHSPTATPTGLAPPPSARGLSAGVLAATYLALALAPLVLAALASDGAGNPWREAATAVGMAGLAMLALQFASSGRFPLLSGRVGIDRTMAFHKITARILALFVLAHPLLYAAPGFLRSPARGWMILEIYFTAEQYRLGLVAWLATLAVVVIAVLRQRLPFGYEAWRASHILLGLAAVGFGVAHAIEVGGYTGEAGLAAYWLAAAGAAAASVVLSHVYRTVAIRVDGWRLVRNEKVGRGLWRLAFRRESGKPFRFRAGQFVWLTTAPRLFPLFDHPFSIASSPREAEVAFVIKEAGDYTRTIGTFAPGTRAGLDGPHGAFAQEGHDADALLLIAGGAGIAPILGLARDLDLADDPRPIRVLVAAGGPERLVGLDDLAAIAARRDLVVHTICEEGGPGYEGALGRLDRAALDRLAAGLDPARTLAMICGPGPFMVAATDGLLDLGLPEDNVLYERFDYADGTLSRLDRAERRRVRLVGLALLLGVAAFAVR